MEIFPAEIWEKILKKLRYSKQINKVVCAFPALKRTQFYHDNKVICIFDKVLPHLVDNLIMKLIKYKPDKHWTVSQEELLKLRLVCKSWRTAVDKVLTTNSKPCFPYQSHFNNFGMSIFRTSEQVESFLYDMKQLKGNPFPGHAVFLKPIKPLFHFTDHLVKSSVKLFDKFGAHIFRLEINIRDNFSVCHLELCRNILKCLRYSPNLRSLSLTGNLDFSVHTETNMYFKNPDSQLLFPELPNLKTLESMIVFDRGNESIWLTRMFKTYIKPEGLRALGLWSDKFVESHLVNDLNDLTDLHLIIKSHLPFYGIKNCLSSLCRNNKLTKLTLSSLDFQCEFVHILKVLNILKDFFLDNVILQSFRLNEEPILDTTNLSTNTSITSLYLEDSLELTYDFLNWLPNLCNLTIFINSHIYNLAVNASHTKTRYLNVGYCLRKYLLKALDPELVVPKSFCLWELYPKLKLITGIVEVRDNDISVLLDVKYVRECGDKVFYGWKPNDTKVDEDLDSEQDEDGTITEIEEAGQMVESDDQSEFQDDEWDEFDDDEWDDFQDDEWDEFDDDDQNEFEVYDREEVENDDQEEREEENFEENEHLEESCEGIPSGWKEFVPADEDDAEWEYNDIKENVESENHLEQCDFASGDENESGESEDIWEDVDGTNTDIDSFEEEDVFETSDNDGINEYDDMENF